MKSKMNVLRKGIVSVMILASVFAFAANAVEAASITVLGNYVTSLDTVTKISSVGSNLLG